MPATFMHVRLYIQRTSLYDSNGVTGELRTRKVKNRTFSMCGRVRVLSEGEHFLGKPFCRDLAVLLFDFYADGATA